MGNNGVALQLVGLGLGLLGIGSSWAGGFADTVARVKQSVVAVGTYQKTDKPPARFLGTGFAVRDGHHVLTNFHVLKEAQQEADRHGLAVFFRRKKRIIVRKAEVAGRDRRFDLALLHIQGEPLRPLALGTDASVREGQRFAFTGFPIGMVLGLHPVTHRGIVSAVTPIATPVSNARQLDRKLIQRLSKPYTVFQLDATAYPGNSGSPLYRPQSGKVVGIINKVFVKESKESLLKNPSGITYAIPIERATELLAEGASE